MSLSILQLSGLPPPPSENSSGSPVFEEDRSEAADTNHSNSERHSPHIDVASNVHGPNDEVQMPSHSNSEGHSPQVAAVSENRTFQSSDNEVQVPSSSAKRPHQVTIDMREKGTLHEDKATDIPEQECGVPTHQNNTQPSSQHGDKLTLGFSNPGLDLCHE